MRRDTTLLFCAMLLSMLSASCSGSGDRLESCAGIPHEIVSIRGVVARPPHPDLASGQSTGGSYQYLFPLRTADDKTVKCKTVEQFKGVVPTLAVEVHGYWKDDIFMVCGVQSSDD